MKSTISSSRGFNRQPKKFGKSEKTKRSKSNGNCNRLVRGSLDRNYRPLRTHRSCKSLNLLLPNLEKPRVIKPMKPWMKGAIQEELKAVRKDRYNRSKSETRRKLKFLKNKKK